MSARLLALLPLIALGCSDPVRPPVTLDLGGTIDATADAPAVDAPTLDRSSPVDAVLDVAPDVTVVDASPDVAVIDASADVTVVDVAPDVTVVDASMDAVVDAEWSDAAVDTGLGAWITLGGGACGARARRVAALSAIHVDPDAGPIEWLTNPPSSGNHYGSWARWGDWPDLARGYWVHNLEHGGVAFLYRCTAAPCATTRDALVAAMNSLPTDPACMPSDAAPARVRVVITNDNVITTPIAAAAWGAVYEATCVDAASLREFYAMFAGRAPEDFCADGFVP